MGRERREEGSKGRGKGEEDARLQLEGVEERELS